MQTRLIAIEEKIAFAEEHLSQLDQTVQELYGRVDQLQRDIRQLTSLVETQSEAPAQGGDGLAELYGPMDPDDDQHDHGHHHDDSDDSDDR